MHKILKDWYDIIFEYNIVPYAMKIDTKTPLPKYEYNAKDSIKENVINYRPIAVQNAIFKIFDGIIKMRIDTWIQKNNIIHLNQGGFKEKIGTHEQIFNLQQIMHKNKNLHLAFLDLKKAYDSVNREKMLNKLVTRYKIPLSLAKILSAIYTDTFSIIKNKGKFSAKFQTTRGLNQGALSSPILFNLYINILIEILEEENIGADMHKKIPILLYADDIILIGKSKNEIKKLIDICTLFAITHDLDFNNQKSYILNANDEWNQLKRLILQNTIIQENLKNNSNCKYLGILIHRTGINTEHEYQKRRNKFKGIGFKTINWINKYNISWKYKLILYKTIIRSQLEFAAPIINYTKQQIEKFEKDQIYILKKIFHLKNTTKPEEILLALNLESIQSRFDTLKINFELKLRKLDNTLAQNIYNEVKKNPITYNQKEISYKQIINNIYKKYNLHHIMNKIDYEYNDIKEQIKHIIHQQHLINTAEKLHKKNNRKEMKEEQYIYAPIHIPISPLEQYIYNKDEEINIKYNEYIPIGPYNTYTEWQKILLNCSYNKHEWKLAHCKHCHQHTTRHYWHQLYECEKYKQNRMQIIDSLFIELQNINININDISNINVLGIIEDAAIDGIIQNEKNKKINQTSWHQITNFLLGNYIDNITFNIKQRRRIKKILHSHLILLAIFCNDKIHNNINEITNIKYKQKQINIDKQDMANGKIIVKTIIDNKINIQNIRTWLDNIQSNEIENYNIGLGMASNRTRAQKIIAQKYSEKVIEKCGDNIISITDGSKIQQKAGTGGIILFKKQPIYEFAKKVETTDVPTTELEGILHNIIKINELGIKNNNIHIIADNKGVIKMCKKIIKIGWKYKDIIQLIYNNVFILQQKNNKVFFHWIPGHTNNIWNDKADELAKLGTNLSFPKHQFFSNWDSIFHFWNE